MDYKEIYQSWIDSGKLSEKELKELEEKEEIFGLSREEKGRMRDIRMNHPKNNAIINRGLFLMYYGIDPFNNIQIVENDNGSCKIVCL